MSVHEHETSKHQHFKLRDLPAEIQRIIFDTYYDPWRLNISDLYWQLIESDNFCLDRYTSDSNYSPVYFRGLPSPNLSLTSKYIYNETKWSLMRSFTGQVIVMTQSSRSSLSQLPQRLNFVLQKTTALALYERAFVDLFRSRLFPELERLVIRCFTSGLPHDLDEAEWQEWAKHPQSVFERRSRKPLLYTRFKTVLDPGYEQWGGNQYVACELAQAEEDIVVEKEACDVERSSEDDALVVLQRQAVANIVPELQRS